MDNNSNRNGMTERKTLADKEEKVGRLSQIRKPHVAPLTTLVEQIRADRTLTDEVPCFDPADGGIDAVAHLWSEFDRE